MLAYLFTLVAGFWLGVSGFLYLGCYLLEEILDLPQATMSVIGSEGASNAHARLKRLVQRVIEEAMALPALLHYSGIQGETTTKLPDFDAKTYEDLLATAILNKVIDRYQQDYDKDRERSSGIHSESASPSSSHVGDEVDLNSNHLVKRALESGLGIDRSTPSPSSIEPLSRDGSNSESSDRFEHVVNTGENHKLDQTVYSSDEDYLEESIYRNPLEGALSTIDFSHKNRVPFPEYGGDIIDIEESHELPHSKEISEDFFNDYHLNGDIHTSNNTWEENWLFQKKRLRTVQSVPVPMLVPNSNTEYRAMIGDRDAEDTTDLSEAGSDSDDVSLDNDIKHVLINSKTIIGGKNLGSLTELTEDVHDNTENFTSLISNATTNPLDTLDVSNINPKNSDDYNRLIKNNRRETIAMLVETDSGALNKAEFTVSEIYRGLDTHEIESLKTNEKLNINISPKFEESDTESLNASNANDSNENAKMYITLNSFTEATNLDVVDSTINNSELNSLQQEESEYSETIAVPVQRHLDSLKRITSDKNSTNSISKPTLNSRSEESDVLEAVNGINSEGSTVSDAHLTNEENNSNEIHELPSGSIAVREKQKWLNAVPMPNNPYSVEAIEKRLSQKNSSIFDIMRNGIPKDEYNSQTPQEIQPPPKTLKDVLAQDVPEFKRYDRDYYIKEAKQSAGSRKKSPHLQDGDNKETEEPESKRQSPTLRLLEEQQTESLLLKTANEPDTNYNDNIYSARPVIISNEETENEIVNDISYGDGIPAENAYHEEFQADDNVTTKFLDKDDNNLLTNLNTSDTASDSISSVDDNMRIYNIQSGKVLSNNSLTEKHSENEQHSGTQLEEIQDSINYAAVQIEKEAEGIELVAMPKVKDLAKMFTASTQEPQVPKPPLRKAGPSVQRPEIQLINKNISNLMGKQPVHMHSLTARSISKEFREELKLSMPTIQKTPGGANEVPEGMDEPLKEQKSSSRPVSPQPVPGTLRSKLAFFEKLNRH